METEKGFKKENSEGNLVPTSSEVGQLLARLFLPILQGLPLTLNLPIKDDPSYETLFSIKQE